MSVWSRARAVVVAGAQTGALMGLGDVLAQALVERTPLQEIQWRRTATFTLVGACCVGPTLRVWYGVLERRFAGRPLYKVAADQLLFAPVFIAGLLSLLEAAELSESKQQSWRQAYPDILRTNYMVWPWVQILNFSYMPLRLQVPTAQTVAVMWNTYISWRTHRQEGTQPAQEDTQTARKE